MHTQGPILPLPNRPLEPTPPEIHDNEADRHNFADEDPDIDDQVYELHRDLNRLDDGWFNA